MIALLKLILALGLCKFSGGTVTERGNAVIVTLTYACPVERGIELKVVEYHFPLSLVIKPSEVNL